MTLAFFLLTVVTLVSALDWMVRRALGKHTARVALLTLLLWLAFTDAMAVREWLWFGPLPPPVMVLVTVSFALTTWLGLSRIGTKLVDRLPVGALVGFQVFRVPVEIFLHFGYYEGMVPVQMTWHGRNLDILTGLTAPIAAWLLWRGWIGRNAILVWNIGGLALLANIVTVAILSMPTPLRAFQNEPANRFVATSPYIWLPTFLVQAAWLGHLLVFRWYRRNATLAK